MRFFYTLIRRFVPIRHSYPVRILMLHNRSEANARGGAERVVAMLAEALREHGHAVAVRVHTTIGFRSLHRMPMLLRAVWHLYDLVNIPSAWSLHRFLRRFQPLTSNSQPPFVIHTHNLVGCGGLTPWVIRRYCRRTGARWVHTLHDVQLLTPSGLLMYGGDVGAAFHGRPSGPQSFDGAQRAGIEPRPYADGTPSTPLERSFLARWFRAARRQLFGSPHVVTSPSRWLLALHRGERFFPESRDAVIGNPVQGIMTTWMERGYADTRMISPPPARRGRPRGGGTESQVPIVAHTNAVGTPSSSPSARGGERSASSVFPVRTLLFVGQLEGHKGIIVLLEAYRQLRTMFPDITLHVVGDGTLLPLLKRATRDVRGLVVRGRLDASGVQTAIAHADVVIVPSLCAENQPSVILEAFVAGVPVVASRVGGIPELVDDGASGFLVNPGSVDDLVRALRACIEDPPRIRAMHEACRARAAAHARDRIAEQFVLVYTQPAG